MNGERCVRYWVGFFFCGISLAQAGIGVRSFTEVIDRMNQLRRSPSEPEMMTAGLRPTAEEGFLAENEEEAAELNTLRTRFSSVLLSTKRKMGCHQRPMSFPTTLAEIVLEECRSEVMKELSSSELRDPREIIENLESFWMEHYDKHPLYSFTNLVYVHGFLEAKDDDWKQLLGLYILFHYNSLNIMSSAVMLNPTGQASMLKIQEAITDIQNYILDAKHYTDGELLTQTELVALLEKVEIRDTDRRFQQAFATTVVRHLEKPTSRQTSPWSSPWSSPWASPKVSPDSIRPMRRVSAASGGPVVPPLLGEEDGEGGKKN